MRLNSSRQDTPTSTRIRVRDDETTVLLPLEPLASTVIFTMLSRIPPNRVEAGINSRAGTSAATRSRATSSSFALHDSLERAAHRMQGAEQASATQIKDCTPTKQRYNSSDSQIICMFYILSRNASCPVCDLVV